MLLYTTELLEPLGRGAVGKLLNPLVTLASRTQPIPTVITLMYVLTLYPYSVLALCIPLNFEM